MEDLLAAMERSQLCVGIDPHAGLLAQWGLPDSAEGAREFSLRVVDELAGSVAALKPQSAFYERFGSAGIAVLEETLAAARERGVHTILDVKRGDIGSTMGGYAEAYLCPGSPLEADSITVSPFLGPGSLTPAVEMARTHGKGVFALCLTSNPDGPAVQHAERDGVPVARAVCQWAERENAESVTVGLVIGATVGDAVDQMGLDLDASRAIILAPGLGAQGAQVADLPAIFGSACGQVLGSVSRAILALGPGHMSDAAARFDLKAAP